MNSKINIMRGLLKFGLLCMLTSSAMADDTDIFSVEKAPATSNVLFVFDNSGSMQKELSSENIPVDPADSRLGVLRTALGSALNAIASNPEIPDINIGMMNFSGHSTGGGWLAHGPSYPAASIKANAQSVLNSNGLFTHKGSSYLPAVSNPATDTSKEFLKTIASQWKPKGKTPLVDALYEAARYLKGDDVHWGKQPPANLRAAHPSTYTGLISTTSTSSTQYVCKKKWCGGNTGVVCNATMNPSSCWTQTEITHNCNLPTESACLAANPIWSSCTLKAGTNCKETCPAGIYDEGVCVSPVTVCTPYSYFRCKETIPPITTCKHEICGNETSTINTVNGSALYKGPITEACQSSHIVLLSDGKPTINKSSGDVKNYIGAASCDAVSDSDELCGTDLARYLANTDHLTTGSNKEGEHRINVHTIGLSLSATDAGTKFLKKIAAEGVGSYSSANSTESLTNALIAALTNTADEARLFSSPSYTLNKTSMLSHGNEVFLPMFRPDASSVWSGNLKKFRLNANGDLMDSNTPSAQVTDANGIVNKNARDEWAAGTVSDAVIDGGVASQLNPSQRKLFSDFGTSTVKLETYPNAAMKAKLGNAGMSDAHKDALLNFIRGKNTAGVTRHHIGDIMHSKPIHLRYSGGKGYVFVGTNEGYLHAFDDQSGKEASAFMPSELLKNIEPQFNSIENKVVSDHLYGVDGEITLWHNDDGNRIVDGSEKAILFFGLRRGGTSYYALDVTTPASPILLWKIDSNSHAGKMSKLGHTWSKPVLANLKHGWPSASVKPVLIFGGGYSEHASGPNKGQEISGKGNAVFIVDAQTGNFIWRADVANAVPAKVRVLDVDRNGSVDRLYFADTGGNIWRADLNASDLNGSGHIGNINEATLMKFADLGSTSSASSRKFFVEPDIAIFKHKGQFVLSVSIGSGERPNPLDTAGDDYFFVLFDEYVLNLPPTSEPAITLSNLKPATVASNVDLISSSRTYKGWYLDLPALGLTSEKILSKALTFQNKVLFTSFGTGATVTGALNKCELASPNVSRLYVMDLLTGGAVLDLNKDGTVKDTPDDRSVLVNGPDIQGTPQVLFKPPTGKGGSCVKGDCYQEYEFCVGKNGCFAGVDTAAKPGSDKLPRVYWIDKNQN